MVLGLLDLPAASAEAGGAALRTDPDPTAPATFRPVTMDPPPQPKSEPTDARPAGGSLNLTKPPGELGVRPAGNAEPPKTDFDVDLHRPKAGDTYEAISKLHYRDARYAEALRQFNRGVGLDRGVDVHVPPMYVLRQRFPQQVGAPAACPAARSGPRPPAGSGSNAAGVRSSP